MPRGGPGQRRGRKGRENTSNRRKARVHTVWTPANLEDAQARNKANAERVAELIQDSRLKSKAKIRTIADNLLVAFNQRDLYADLILKRDLTADEGKAANAVRKDIQTELKALGVDSMMDEDDCRACAGTGKINGKTCEHCNGTGEEPV